MGNYLLEDEGDDEKAADVLDNPVQYPIDQIQAYMETQMNQRLKTIEGNVKRIMEALDVTEDDPKSNVTGKGNKTKAIAALSPMSSPGSDGSDAGDIAWGRSESMKNGPSLQEKTLSLKETLKQTLKN